jgi:hypothetical protein
MSWNETCSAVRHNILVDNKYEGTYIPSRTGRNNRSYPFFYHYQVPDGIFTKTISENFKELAI